MHIIIVCTLWLFIWAATNPEGDTSQYLDILEEYNKLVDLKNKIDRMKDGSERFTLVIDDPISNSYLQACTLSIPTILYAPQSFVLNNVCVCY